MKKRLLAVDAATSVATAAMIAAVAPVTTEGASAAACQPAYAAGAIYPDGVRASYGDKGLLHWQVAGVVTRPGWPVGA